MIKIPRCREEGDLALEEEDEAGGDFQHRGLKPTEDRFMRLDDMERFVRAAEQREMDDDEDDEEQTGDDSGNDQILNICRHSYADMCSICPRQSTMAATLLHVMRCCVCSIGSLQLIDYAMQMKIRTVSRAAGAGPGRQRWTARMRQPWMSCSTRPAGNPAAGESNTMLATNCTGVVTLQEHESQVVANAGMWS